MGVKHHADTKPLGVDIYQYRVNVNTVLVRAKEVTCHTVTLSRGCTSCDSVTRCYKGPIMN